MTTPTPPAGWYADPTDPRQQRWWNGTAWSEFTTAWQSDATAQQSPSRSTSVPPIGAAPEPAGPRQAARGAWRPSLTTWIVAAIAVLAGLIGAGTNGFGGFLVGISLFGVGAGIWALGSGKASWLNLPRTRRAAGSALGISAAVLVLGALIAPHPQAGNQAAPVKSDTQVGSTASPAPAAAPKKTATATPKPTPTPVTTVQIVETSDAIGFGQSSYEDPNVDAGTNVVVTSGTPGTKVSRWEITLVDGVEKGRVLVSETVTVAPVDEVTAIGTRAPAPPPEAAPAPESAPEGGRCDPNYAGACVPIASDVDCAGGKGNGPAYVAGPVQVIGSDIYDLDRDGDGIACD